MKLKWKLIAQSCPTLWDPRDCILPNFFVYGILQARVLEWVANSFSRASSLPGIEPRSPALLEDSLLTEPLEKPNNFIITYLYFSTLVKLIPGILYFLHVATLITLCSLQEQNFSNLILDNKIWLLLLFWRGLSHTL